MELNPIFFGNPRASHLHHWVKIYRLSGYEGPIRLATIESKGVNWPYGEIIYSPINWGPTYLRYIVLGVFARICVSGFVHAHSASGYAFSALLSGRSYIVTVYGSEVEFCRLNLFHKTIVKYNLKKAKAITVTSVSTSKKLSLYYHTPSDKIHYFHTGFDPVEGFVASKMGNSGNVVLSIRSIAPTYRTLELIYSLSGWLKIDSARKLILPAGHANYDYLKQCRDLIEKLDLKDNIEIIDTFLSKEEFYQLICNSDVSLSLPINDQIGSSIVESLYFGVPVILSCEPESYESLSGFPGCFTMKNFCELPGLLDDVLSMHLDKKQIIDFSKTKFSINKAAEEFSALIRKR